MGNKILEDAKGNKSSKRLCGVSLIALGALFSSVLFAYSLFKDAEDATTSLGVINIILMAGGGMLGIGVFEKGLKK
jgi:hypothetical protein